MIYLSIVPKPPGPFANWHVALYGYFPGAKDLPQQKREGRQNAVQGTQRPYVWRLLDGDRVAMLSKIKPACPSAPINARAGVALDFAATLRCDGFRNRNRNRSQYVRNRAEIRQWVKRAAADGGCEVTYLDVGEPRRLVVKRHRKPDNTMSIVDVKGIAIAHDADAFERFLVFGGPGTGKVYGCGMWWIPALYEQAMKEAA